MKRVIGNKWKIRIIVAFMAIVVLAIFFINQPNEYQEEVNAIKSFMRYFDEPDELIVNSLERYVVAENEIFYYVEWQYPIEYGEEEYSLLLIYNPVIKRVELKHFTDFEGGLYATERIKWESVKDNPDRIFTEEEMTMIKDKAAAGIIK